MRSDLKTLIATGAAIAGALALASCASTPKPAPQPPAPAPQQTPPPPPPETPPPPPVQSAPTGPIPGSIQDFVINAGERVYFDYDKYQVRDDARPVLDAQASWLTRYGQVKVRIEGNADERGTAEYNMALGERRANAVREYLIGHGVDKSRIEVVSYGKSRPIDTGANEEAWAKNRNAHTAITAGAQ
jgi:peptidoglycan-associated lipoprotein